ncbi:MAG: GEVED domain-containing protein [Limisphaerales bacterium]
MKRPFSLRYGRWLVVSAIFLLIAGGNDVQAQAEGDYGDAPAPYPTKAQDGGAYHKGRAAMLGAVVDIEIDGQPHPLAEGDDLNGEDDEDGVVFLTDLIPGQLAEVEVSVSGAPNGAFLSAWVDFGADGSWDATDQIIQAKQVFNGVGRYRFQVPQEARLDGVFARFRISSNPDLSPKGIAPDGEVEDYLVRSQSTGSFDFGDAPYDQKNGPYLYPTLLAQGGARHRIVEGFCLGELVDGEADGQPVLGADGDDKNPVGSASDEDGVLFSTGVVAGNLAEVKVLGNMSANDLGLLNAWVDFNQDGDWADVGEQIITDEFVLQGVNAILFSVPADALGGKTYARFRLNRSGKLGYSGPAEEGEVEDYIVNVEARAAYDFGDAPQSVNAGFAYPTTLAFGGAYHSIVEGFCLGQTIDGESDGQPTVDAKGDDNNPAGGGSDEDGIAFPGPLLGGQNVPVQVMVSLPATIKTAFVFAWVDFNRDGDWADPGERVWNAELVVAGLNTIPIAVPADISFGNTFVRFRLSSSRDVGAGGGLPDGEVEDYLVSLASSMDFGDAPRPYPTALSVDGARHVKSADFFLGSSVDVEGDGVPEALALGDDLANLDDEDGVTFTSPLVPGAGAAVRVEASSTGFLYAWVDFNANGSWADEGEQIFGGVLLSGGLNDLAFNVPADAVQGRTFARFRYTVQGRALGYTGAAPDGEVEDYAVEIVGEESGCDLNCMAREFWLTFPGNYDPDPVLRAEPRLRIHGAAGATGVVQIPGLAFSTAFTVPATGGGVTINLPTEADLDDLNDQVRSLGIHVKADRPVSVTGINRVPYTTDSYLGLGVPVLGRVYIVHGFGNVHDDLPPLNGSQFAVVGVEDGTLVRITPSVTTGTHPVGVPFDIELNAGDVYQLRNTDGAPADLTGTLIRSSSPVAVFGSHQCANVPTGDPWYCDHLLEQLLPVNSWGRSFLTAPLITRSGGDTFRVVAALDGTTVTRNGVVLGVLNSGQFLDLSSAVPQQISANAPISLMQYANSSDFDGVHDADPFMMTVQAVSQYQAAYVLWAPDASFSNNYLHLIVPTADTGAIRVDGVVVGAGAFAALGTTGYSYGRVWVSAAASHTVTGRSPFGASIYGWSEYESYGHPGCFSLGDVKGPTVQPPVNYVSVSVADYPNSPGRVPLPDFTEASLVSDNCDQTVLRPQQDPKAGTLLPPGRHLIRLWATDISGNEGEAYLTYEVTDPAPVTIECPADMVVECTSRAGAVVKFEVNAYTQYETDVTVVSDPPSGSLFPQGTTVVKCRATSLAGEVGSCFFTVTVECNRVIRLNRRVSGQSSLVLEGLPTGSIVERSTSINGPWEVYATGVSSVDLQILRDQDFFFRFRE